MTHPDDYDCFVCGYAEWRDGRCWCRSTGKPIYNHIEDSTDCPDFFEESDDER